MNPNPELQSEAPQVPNLMNLDWGKSTAVEVRKLLAKNFEHFLLDNMNAGRVDPDRAQSTASMFVKIFETAVTSDAIDSALDTLSQDKNALLQNFYLKVEEMRMKQVSIKLYEFMAYLVDKGDVSLARHLFKMYESGELNTTAQMEQIKDEFTIKSQVNAAVKKLNDAGLTKQSAELNDAFANNRIRTEADLAPWVSITVGLPQTTNIDSVTATKKPLAQAPGLVKGVVDAVHKLDSALWSIIRKGKDKKI